MLMLEKEWKLRQTPFHDCRCLCYNSNTTVTRGLWCFHKEKCNPLISSHRSGI